MQVVISKSGTDRDQVISGSPRLLPQREQMRRTDNEFKSGEIAEKILYVCIRSRTPEANIEVFGWLHGGTVVQLLSIDPSQS